MLSHLAITTLMQLHVSSCSALGVQHLRKLPQRGVSLRQDRRLSVVHLLQRAFLSEGDIPGIVSERCQILPSAFARRSLPLQAVHSPISRLPCKSLIIVTLPSLLSFLYLSIYEYLFPDLFFFHPYYVQSSIIVCRDCSEEGKGFRG